MEGKDTVATATELTKATTVKTSDKKKDIITAIQIK